MKRDELFTNLAFWIEEKVNGFIVEQVWYWGGMYSFDELFYQHHLEYVDTITFDPSRSQGIAVFRNRNASTEEDFDCARG